MAEHQVNLFARYEQRLLSDLTSKPRAIPAVVITGFLGSGKTTLVQHILRNRGSLRIAVLVNEVGQLDVDSELVNARQSNAALGLPAADLSGGCVCCSRSEDLAAALRRIRHPGKDAAAGSLGAAAGSGVADGPCDYLLVETSGAADAGPLAEALVAEGFRLDAVVAVVDAEAGWQALEHPVARAQVACADVVVLNKCDLVMGPAPSPLLEPLGPTPQSPPAAAAAAGDSCGAGAGTETSAAPPTVWSAASGVSSVLWAPGGAVAVAAVASSSLAVGGGVGGRGRGLGALADLEDLLGAMAPGVRVVRARFGEVPLTAVLDVEPVGAPAGEAAASAAVPAAAGAAAAGELPGGFMSHESVPAGAAGGGHRLASGPLTADGLVVGSSRHAARRNNNNNNNSNRAGQTAASASAQAPPAPSAADPQASSPHPRPHGAHHRGHSHSHPHPHPHGGPTGPHSSLSTGAGALPHSGPPGHAHLHVGFHTESVTAGGEPCSLVAFAEFVIRHLVREPALLRSKGVMWFSERRSHRFTFHLSGRRRVECALEGPWEGPPATHLVLIGSSPDAVIRLRDLFIAEVVRGEAAGGGAEGGGAAGGGSRARGEVAERRIGAPGEGTRYGGGGGATAAAAVDARSDAVAAADSGTAAVAAAAAELVANERLEVLEPWPTGAATGAERLSPAPSYSGGDVGSCPGAGCGGGGYLVSFTTRGSALHGINGEELNAELLRRANAGGRVMLAAVTAPGRVSAVTNVRMRDRVLSLLLPLSRDPPTARLQARAVVEAVEPLLRKAYAHVHNCKCDVAAGMAGMAGMQRS